MSEKFHSKLALELICFENSYFKNTPPTLAINLLDVSHSDSTLQLVNEINLTNLNISNYNPFYDSSFSFFSQITHAEHIHVLAGNDSILY